MNTNDNPLSELLTGREDTDSRLQAAFDLGLRRGKALDRESVQRNIQIHTIFLHYARKMSKLLCLKSPGIS